jgi:KDO2-lipid IV(A) lauroyltransferase
MWPIDLVLAAIAVAFAAPLWFLPWKWAARLGELYGLCAFALWPSARRVAQINLRRAYGSGMDRSRATTWTKNVFRSLGRAIAEGLQFARRYKRHGDPGFLIEAEDPELEARIVADKRPKVFVTGHLGSWEVAIGAAARRTNANGAAIVRRIDNPFLNAVVRRVRLRHGSEWIEKRGASAQALRRLRGGESIAMLSDENGGRRGVFVDFFGRPASTHRSPALLSVLTGAPIVVGAALRRGPGFVFKLALIEPRAPAEPAAFEREIRRLTSELTTTLEGWVREYPTQWRWIHWRWRTRPEGSEETYQRSDVDSGFLQDAPVLWRPELDARD